MARHSWLIKGGFYPNYLRGPVLKPPILQVTPWVIRSNHQPGSSRRAHLYNPPHGPSMPPWRLSRRHGSVFGAIVCPVDSMIGKLNKVQLHWFSSRRMDKNQYISAVHEMDLNAPFASFLCVCVCNHCSSLLGALFISLFEKLIRCAVMWLLLHSECIMCLFIHSFISFHFISFHFSSVQFISFHFMHSFIGSLFHFILVEFILCHFISIQFSSIYAISFHFNSIYSSLIQCHTSIHSSVQSAHPGRNPQSEIPQSGSWTMPPLILPGIRPGIL